MTKPMTYWEFCEEYRGMEFKSDGRVICKAAAFELHRLGRWQKNKVTAREKPGWEGGKLVKSRDYDRYFEQLTF